jgi:hypothetical protein
MNTPEFQVWYEIFWKTYGGERGDLLHNSRGVPEGTHKDKLSRMTPDKLNMIMEALRAQIRYARAAKDKGEEKTKWHFPMLSVWVNQKRWLKEIPSHTELHRSTNTDFTCRKCPAKVKVKLTICDNCKKQIEEEQRPSVRENLRKMGLYTEGQGEKATAKKCREYLLETGLFRNGQINLKRIVK